MPFNPDTLPARQSFDAAIGSAILDPGRGDPAGIVGPRGKAAVKRFNVYRNNVTYSLVTALTEIFPVVTRILGEQNFRMIARDFLRAHPPRSRLVFQYGHRFAAFLADFGPVQHLKYLPDVARLERAWLDAYHAADAAPLSPEALGAFPPDALASLRFEAHPATHLVRSDYAVHTIFVAHSGDAMPVRIDAAAPEEVLVTRPQLQVGLRKLAPGQATFISSLLGSATLQEAAETAVETTPSFDLAAAISMLLECGAFSDCHPANLSPQEQE